MNKTRKSNIELLRYISMLLILFFHFKINIFSQFSIETTQNYILLQTYCLFNLGVNIFMFIFGYFSVKRNNIKRITKLLICTMFYTVLLFLIFAIKGDIQFTLNVFVNYFYKLMKGGYWFIIAYTIVFFLSPLIVIIINKLGTKKSYYWVVSIASICFTLLLIGVDSTIITIMSTIILYSFGLLWRLEPVVFIKNNKIKTTIASVILLVLTLFMLVKVNGFSETFDGVAIILFDRFSPFTIIPTICIFQIAIEHEFYNEKINKYAKYIFGVYLIHNNSLLSTYIWKDIFIERILNTWILVPYMLMKCVLVMIACIFLDMLREKLFIQIEKLIPEKYRLFS